MRGKQKLEYNESDFIEVTPTPSLNLPDIVAEKCMKPKDGSPYLVFYCKAKELYRSGCTSCGSIDIVKHGTTSMPRVVHDIMVSNNRIDLVISVQRYRCNDCGAAFREPLESVLSNRHITTRLYEQLCHAAFNRPFSDVAVETGYGESHIRNIFDEYAAELESYRGPIVAPRILGIDEKHIAHAARGVFVDIETGRLLEMTENNKKATVTAVIESMVDYDKNIKLVTTDMASGYRSCVYECLPQAKLIVDKYHVYQDLYRKIASSKTAIMAATARQIEDEPNATKQAHLKSVRNLVVHNAYLFKFGKKKLAEKSHRMVIMADVCKTFPEFNHLRLIKQGFERIYEESKSRAKAEALYDEWLPLIPPKGAKKVLAWEQQYGVNAELFDGFRTFKNTTQNWKTEIFNYFDPGCNATNAATEGTNSMIQRINAQGAGYGFKRLRAKALYTSNAGPQVSYSIKISKAPIYGSNPSFSYVHGSPNTQAKKIVGYEDRAEIVRDRNITNNSWSVLSYIDKDSDFYDFELDDL